MRPREKNELTAWEIWAVKDKKPLKKVERDKKGNPIGTEYDDYGNIVTEEGEE